MLLLAFALGCQSQSPTPVSLGITPEKHTWFAIGAGSPHELGATTNNSKMDCRSCHPADTTSFTQISCVNCHGHEETATDRLHLTVKGYSYTDSPACYSCHSTGGKVPFDHGGINNDCATCHDVGAPFAALPKAKFVHPEVGGTDCSGCHNTTDWAGATGAPNAHDPAHNVLVQALLPTFNDTSIVNLAAQVETLPMTMNHGSTDAPAAVMSDCAGCHPRSAESGASDPNKSGLFPGTFHASLAGLGFPQPAACGSCHLDSMPIGFVGPTSTNPARVPTSGEMRHEAVAWVNEAPTGTRVVTTNCGVCHRVAAGGSTAVTWATGKTAATVQFHGALAAAAMPQPTSCLDCHASTRPRGVLTSGATTLAAGITFDHATEATKGDCAACHAAGVAPSWSSWRSGKFHLAGAANPPSCLPCHAGERPTSATAWTSPTYKISPFDYGTNAAGSTHGDGQDCALCHNGPGTGAWGGTQTWAGGHFNHGPQTVSATSCIVCHSTQRPDLQQGTTAAAMASALGFDHATNGTGECIGCHAATVAVGLYTNYDSPTTRALPGGDWKGAVTYPGASFSSSDDQFINVTETVLIRDSTPARLVTATTTVTDTIYNGMSHVSTILPAALSAGATTAPDNSKCWHCHTNNNGVVTAFRDGQYHSSLAAFRASTTSAVSPLPQPTAQCSDCHAFMMPDGIVELNGSDLWPMDHSAVLANPITVNGATVAKVSDLDCSFCHKSPGVKWGDGIFHANLPSTAVVSDCVSCHYPIIADAPTADTVNGTQYQMKHLSKQVTAQACQPCHPSAVSQRALLPASAALFKPGIFHAAVATQATACLDCHVGSQPGANLPTQSSWSYALTAGGTSSNGAQWMNHGSSLVAGKDCAACHLDDAQMTGSVWSKATSLHAAAPTPRTCQECHGLINGGGGVPGMNNNLPLGLTSSTVATSASAATGIAAGTLSQIDHADMNVASRDCNVCHSQVGRASSAALQGKEWAQARFHASLSGTTLLMNGTTGRCSNCHMNVNPKSSYNTFNHSGFTSASGSTDCSNCHSYPGTGTAASPNWLGATSDNSGR